MEENFVKRVLETFRTEGPKGIWRKTSRRLSSKPKYRRLLVLDLLFTDDIPVVEPTTPVTFERLQPSDYDELIALRPYLTKEVIELRLEAGHHFYVVRFDGKIIYTRQVAVNKAYSGYLEMAFPLSPREVCFAEAFAVPEHRGNRIHQASNSFLSRTLYQQGYHHAILLVYPRNRPALAADYKLGCEKRGYIGYWEVLGIRRYFYQAKEGGLDGLSNTYLAQRHELVPAELQGQIW